MEMDGAVLLLSLFAAVAGVIGNSPINYCGSRMCGNTDNHTFCQYHEGPSPQCVGYISAEMTMEEKARVVARLNRRRNEAAAGQLQGLPTAGNMLKMRWVEELAHEAQLWADQCISPNVPEEHDVCRDLYSVPVGQCVASVIGEAPGLRVESMVDIWYMQSLLYKGNVTMYILPNLNNSFYGDFAQIMWAKSYMVGCGRSRFMINWQGRLRAVERLVCNIAPAGPPQGRPLWSPSSPASLCPAHSKPDNMYKALCDIQKESMSLKDVDPSMTVEEHILMYSVLDLDSNNTTYTLGTLDQNYLTRLAVATIGNTGITEAYYNSLPKKDIIEIIELEDSKTRANNVSYSQIEVIPNATTAVSSVKVNAKQRIAFIGRPKPYNMAELTDIEYNTEHYSFAEDTKDDNEIYPDYEFVETMQDGPKMPRNVTKDHGSLNETVKDVAKLNKGVNITDVKMNLNANSSMLSAKPINKMNNKVFIDNLLDSNDSQLLRLINESNVPLDDIEEYLDDPETVRELQEALDRMEREMSTPPRQDHVANERPARTKVRRELREPSNQPDSQQEYLRNEMREDQNYTDMMNLALQNISDSAPLYNMMMKYMPYFKQYGDASLLTKSANGASRISSSVVLVLLLCV